MLKKHDYLNPFIMLKKLRLRIYIDNRQTLLLKKLRLRIETEEKDQQNSTAMENHPERYPNLDIYCVRYIHASPLVAFVYLSSSKIWRYLNPCI